VRVNAAANVETSFTLGAFLARNSNNA